MAKKRLKVIDFLIYLYFILFPFGHLITFRVNFLQRTIPFNASDIIAFCFFVSALWAKYGYPKIFSFLKNFLLVAVFSQIVFIFQNGLKDLLIGSLYLLRLFAYSGMFVVVWNRLKNRGGIKKKIFEFLIVATFFIAVFGWLQYFLFPDLRPFTVWGWDDHLFRIVGTFIDPTFTAIILVFGTITSLTYFQKSRKTLSLFAFIIMLLALCFTYSRAGYLSLIVGFLTYISLKRKIKVSIIVLPLFVLGLFFLPRPSSEGVHLERTYSIKARFQNYYETAKIFAKNPVFGVGYNNFCWARQKYFNDINPDSHSCSGSDSSVLLILATTGIVGFMMFLFFILSLVKQLDFNFYGTVFLSCLSSVFVHSLFSNSLFYPWVMGYFVFLASLALKE